MVHGCGIRVGIGVEPPTSILNLVTSSIPYDLKHASYKLLVLVCF